MRSNLKAWVLVYSLLVVVLAAVGLIIAGGPTGIDTSVMSAVEGMRDLNLTSVVSILTELFSPAIVPVWALIVAGVFLYRDRRLERASVVLGSVVGAAAVAEVIKIVVARPRPPAIDQLSAYEATLSYPSGHVTGTGALMVGTALAGTAAYRRAARALAVAVALLVTVFVAWTRLYLGVHWFTDVTAGLVVGAATAAITAPTVPWLLALVSERVGDRIPQRAVGWIAAEAPSTGKHAVAAVNR